MGSNPTLSADSKGDSRPAGYTATVAKRLSILLLVLALSVVAAPVAQADDNSVYQAWIAHDAEFDKHGAAVRKNERSDRSARSKAKRLIEIVEAARKTLAENTAGVDAQQPSSERGGDGKTLALKSNARLDLSFLSTRKAMRLFLDGASRRKVVRYLDRADSYIDEAVRYEKKARTAFRDAGVTLKD